MLPFRYRMLTYSHQKILADTLTPVGVYLRLRDQFATCVLLESADQHGQEHAVSYLAADPIATFEARGADVRTQLPGRAETRVTLAPDPVTGRVPVLAHLADFAAQLAPNGSAPLPATVPELATGLFGMMSYEALTYGEDLALNAAKLPPETVPTLRYDAFRFVLAFDHAHHRLHLLEATPPGETPRGLDALRALVQQPGAPRFGFARTGPENTNQTDDEFLAAIGAGQHHCQRGDVFQMVLSRRFQQAFRGDDFNVYRALRAVSPSPYLFYFDYGAYRLLGSSPEAQLQIRRGTATLHPIAGTFRRTGDDAQDAALATRLAADPKENAEHVMLVDLARNDLARHGHDVRVAQFREVQFYSHVLHLVSRVTARVAPNTPPLALVGATFPAGTLTGAPKYRAMQLIDSLEPTARGFYGGCIGHLGFDGDFHHAILIRSALSAGGVLTYQAGAGVVAASDPTAELREVDHKLAAVRGALDLAETLHAENEGLVFRV